MFITSWSKLGAIIAFAARYYGARSVTVASKRTNEKNDLLRYGFNVFDSSIETTSDLIRRVTGGHGFDYAFETSGNSEGYEQVMELVKRGAVIGIMEKSQEPYTFFVKTAIRSQPRFIGIKEYSDEDKKESERVLAGGSLFSKLQNDENGGE